jgi:hypothetical protein
VDVKKALSRVPPAGRKDVLERVAVDVLAEIDAATTTATTSETASMKPAMSSDVPASNGGGTLVLTPPPAVPTQGGSIAEKIVSYCVRHPSPSGVYRIVDVTEALFPDKDRTVAQSTISTVITRRMVGESKNPYFVRTKPGHFRIATPDERGQAQEAKKS